MQQSLPVEPRVDVAADWRPHPHTDGQVPVPPPVSPQMAMMRLKAQLAHERLRNALLEAQLQAQSAPRRTPRPPALEPWLDGGAPSRARDASSRHSAPLPKRA